MLESFVDLTYRGLSLGRRIRLSQIRPSTGYLELPAPMPVGAQIAIAAEDGVTFDAIVTGVHEQVSGSDRTPGMIVAPALDGAEAAAWWTSRVMLPDDEARRRPVTAGRSRPPTVRPRSRTDQIPASAGAIDPAAAAADLQARVTAAAGVAPGRVDDPHEARTMVMPLEDIEAIAAQARPESEPPIRRTGEHEVVDDGNRTVLMDSIDPAMLGMELAALSGASPHAEPIERRDTIGDDDRGDASDSDSDDGDGDDADVTDPGDTLTDSFPAQPGGGRRRRRKSRR